MALCHPGHRHDALCDPVLTIPRRQPDPDVVMKGHREFMREKNQDGWLAWQLSRPLSLREPKQGKRASGVPVKKKR
jgi:hypothetical protein